MSETDCALDDRTLSVCAKCRTFLAQSESCEGPSVSIQHEHRMWLKADASSAVVDDVSDSLVPGDVVDIADASLDTFPADLVLLSGDAIVNESMLTGESVPVSKYPVEAANIELISRGGGEIPPDQSRHIVFSGTKIIRIRKTSPPGVPGGEAEALGMVTRTGEHCCCGFVKEGWLTRNLCKASTRPRVLLFDRCCSQSLSVSPSTATRSDSLACSQLLQCWASWAARSTLSNLE